MPFKSDKQRKWMHANEPEMAKKWEKKSKAEGTTTPFPSALIDKAIKVAKSMGGNMTGAVKKIEKIKKGLSKNGRVEYALQQANESDIEEGFGGELKGKDKEKFEKARKENAEQLGYKLTGESDIREAKFDSTGVDWSGEMMWKWVSKALKAAGIKELKYTPMKSGWLDGKFIWGGFYKVQANKRTDVLPITVDKKGNVHLNVSPKKFIIGKIGKLPQVVKNLKDFKKSDMDVYESVNEGDKKKYWDLYAKWYKTYEAFARETMNLAKSATKIGTTGSSDERIILKNFKKQVIPFIGLMSSWSKGHEKNPHISESDLGYTTKKQKVVRAVHKTSGKEIIVVDTPSSRKTLKKIGFVVKESVNEAVKVRNGEAPMEGMWAVCDISTGKAIKEVGNVRAATRLMNRLMNSGQYKEVAAKWVGDGKNESVNESWNQLRTTLVNIVRKKQYKKIDGVMVDMQTANLILKVWDALNKSNRSKFEKLPIKKMATVAWKLMK